MSGRLTEAQIKLARSALGLVDGRTVSYRNRYVAARHSLNEIAWDDLVRKGFAVRGTPSATMVGFCLTYAGAEAVLLPGESLDPEDFPDANRRALAERKDGE